MRTFVVVVASFALGCSGSIVGNMQHCSGAACKDGGTTGGGNDGGTTGGNDGGTTGGNDGGTTGGNDGGTSGGTTADSFPSTAIWYQDSSNAALDAQSQTVIQGLQNAGGWGAGSLQIDFSIVVLHADATVARRTFTPNGNFYSPDCDPVPIPVPPGGAVEGNPDYHCADGGDCHLLVYQGTKLYEVWTADITGGSSSGGTFTAGCAVEWDLTKDYWQPAAPPNFARGDQCTSADAAGYPMAPLLFYGDELAAGHIDHAIRFILPNARMRKGVYVHPATHAGSPSGGSTLPPYGTHLRLRADYDLTTLPSDAARTVARALQKYGMFLADGGNIALTAEQSAAQYIAADALSQLQVTDFEMVDGGSRITYTGDCARTPLTN